MEDTGILKRKKKRQVVNVWAVEHTPGRQPTSGLTQHMSGLIHLQESFLLLGL